MSAPSDPRIFFAAERTLLAWQRSSLALMGFGFVIERFSLFLSVLRHGLLQPIQHSISVLTGVGLILLGACAALLKGFGYRRIVGTLPPDTVPAGYCVHLGVLINLAIAVVGALLAIYLLVGAY